MQSCDDGENISLHSFYFFLLFENGCDHGHPRHHVNDYGHDRDHVYDHGLSYAYGHVYVPCHAYDRGHACDHDHICGHDHVYVYVWIIVKLIC